MEEEFENYKKWGIQHFLMKFPSLNLLKIFMRWIDTNFNLQNSEGRTPLHLFCLWNNEGSLFNHHTDDPLPHINYPEMAQFTGTACLGYLLENGLTPNVLDINRSTPLLYATMRAQLAFVKLLRNFGSTINNVNSLNQVPLIELIRMKNRLTLPQIETILSD
jgi:ankyrin repeat protein